MFTLIAACIGAGVALVTTGVSVGVGVYQADQAEAATKENQAKQHAHENELAAQSRARDLQMAKRTASAGMLALSNTAAEQRRSPVGGKGFAQKNTPWFSSASQGIPAQATGRILASRSGGLPNRSLA